MPMCKAIKSGLTACGLLLATACFVFASPSFAGKLYKWVDKDGTVHYSDRLPPEASKKQHKELGSQGLTKKEVEKAKSDEQIMAERQQALLAEQERRRKAEEQARIRRKNRILLDTFTTERDLLLTRDDRLNAVDSIINLTATNNKRTNEEIQQLKSRVANIEKSGREVPEATKARLAELISQYTKNVEFLELKRKERKELEARFTDDLNRYRELKGITPPSDKKPETQNTTSSASITP